MLLILFYFSRGKCGMAPKKAASLLGLEELTNNKNGLGKALVAEAIGVFFINYFGCLSCLKAASQTLKFTAIGGDDSTFANTTFVSNEIQVASQTVAIALSFGLIVFAMVQVNINCYRIILKIGLTHTVYNA